MRNPELNSIDRLYIDSEKKTNIRHLNVSPHGKYFPVEAFPAEIQRIIKTLDQTLGFPTCYTSAGVLAAAAAAIGNSAAIEVLPGWHETPIFFVCMIGQPGDNKSHPLQWALKPLLNADQKSYIDYKSRLQTAGTDDPAPVWQKTIVADATSEAIASVHESNPRGLLVYSDEMLSWLKSFDRYRSGADQQFWISNWSGKPIFVDRKASTSIMIPKPCVSVIGTIQPAALMALTDNQRQQTGFTDRILFVHPNVMKKRWSDVPLDENTGKIYGRIIKGLMSLPVNGSPLILRYTPVAKDRLFEWQAANVTKINEADSDLTKGILSKMEIIINRIALTLHMLEVSSRDDDSAFEVIASNSIERIYKAAAKRCHPDKSGDETKDEMFKKLQQAKDTGQIERVRAILVELVLTSDVEVETIENAIKITDYFTSQAYSVTSSMDEDAKLVDLSSDKRSWYENLPYDIEITSSDAVLSGMACGLHEKTVRRMLQDKTFFTKAGHGKYLRNL